MTEQRQAQLVRIPRGIAQLACSAIPISIIGFGSDSAMRILRDQWHLGFWQREIAYTVASIAVIAIGVLVWTGIDGWLFGRPAGQGDTTRSKAA